MRALGIQASTDCEVPLGTVVAILPQHVEQHWTAVEGLLRTVETWTQLLSADDIRPSLLDGRLQMWSVLVPEGSEKWVFALTRLSGSSRGQICTVWLIASELSDDTAVSALIDRCEAVAKSWYSGLLGLNGSSLGGSSQSNNGAAATQDAGLGISALGTAAELAYLY